MQRRAKLDDVSIAQICVSFGMMGPLAEREMSRPAGLEVVWSAPGMTTQFWDDKVLDALP